VRAVAWADDGTVEAIELTGVDFAVGVQWHAEGLIDEAHHCALFAQFAEAAERYRSRATRPRAA
jgi:putative glutamine amidotransferase